MLISSLSLTFLSTKSFKPFFEKNEIFSSGVVRFIVSPGHRQTRTSNSSFILFISTLFEVKNSSLGSHSTLVPCSLLFPISRFEKTPSLKDTFSNFPSLKEVTTNQCAKKFVSLLPIPLRPKAVPSYTPSSVNFPEVLSVSNAACKIVLPSSLLLLIKNPCA